MLHILLWWNKPKLAKRRALAFGSSAMSSCRSGASFGSRIVDRAMDCARRKVIAQ